MAKIGRKSKVIVNAAGRKPPPAHDLRRSLGTRWAKRVMPAVLQKLMRHASISTTMAYYVDLDVDEMADDLWAKHPAEKPAAAPGNISGNTAPTSVENEASPATVTDCEALG